MPATVRDRLTPAAVGLVSRGWVIAEVERALPGDVAAQTAAIDALCAYEPPRRHPVRNTVIFWVGVFGSTMLADAVGLPGWIGFVAALAGFAGLARTLAVRALRWRLGQWMDDRAAA